MHGRVSSGAAQVKRMVGNLYESSGLLAVRKEGDFAAGFH